MIYLLSSRSFRDGHTDTEDGIGTKLGLVLGSIELVQEGINGRLVFDIEILFDEGWSNDIVDIGNGLGDTWSCC